MNIDKKIEKLYNAVKKIRLYKKIFFLVYIIFLISSIVFFSYVFKYPLSAKRLGASNIEEIKRMPLNKNKLTQISDDSSDYKNYYKIYEDSFNQILYNFATDNIVYKKKSKTNTNTYVWDIFETNQYKEIAKDQGLTKEQYLNFYKKRKNTFKALFSNFILDIKYSSAPEESAIQLYSSMATVKEYYMLESGDGFIINYHFKSDPYDRTLFPNQFNNAKRNEIITKIKAHFKNSPAEQKKYIKIFNQYRQKDKNKNALYYLEYPDRDILEFIKDLHYIWYTIYKLTDNELVKFNVGKRINKYEFIVPVMYRVVNNEFKVSILTNEIKEDGIIVDNAHWIITKIFSNLNFLNINHKNTNNQILVPDGSGAIIDSKHTKRPFFRGSIYQNDYYLSDSDTTKNDPIIKAPIFGVSMDSNDSSNPNTTGVLLNVTRGYNQANLIIDSSSDYKQIYSVFNYRLSGETEFVSGEKREALSSKYTDDLFETTYNVMTKNPVDGQKLPVNYVDFATLYASRYLSHLSEIDRRADIAIEFLNSIIKREHILGIPYNKQYSLTTFDEAEKIKALFKDYSKTYFYRNWQQNGLYSQIPIKRQKMFAKLGSKDELEDSYYLMNFVKTYNDKYKGFTNSANGMRTVKNAIRNNYELDVINNKYLPIKDLRYYLLSPKYYLDAARRFKGANPNFKNIALVDFANNPTVELTDQKYSPKVVENIKKDVIENISSGTVAIKNPYLNMLRKKAVIFDTEPSSSNKEIYFSTVPFYETLLAKFYKVFLRSANVSSLNQSRYYFLYSLLSGANMKYTLTYKTTEITKMTRYNMYNSTKYDIYEREIHSFYHEMVNFYNHVGKKLLSSYPLDNNIFLAEYYNNGKINKVLFNLNELENTITYNGEKYNIEGLNFRRIY